MRGAGNRKIDAAAGGTDVTMSRMKPAFPCSPAAAGRRLLITSKLDRILVPVDFSPLSILAVRAALALMKGNPKAHLTLVHVVEALPDTAKMGNVTMAATEVELLRELAEEHLARLRLDFGRGIQFGTQVVMGNPIWELSRLTAGNEFDLVVMTSHGRTGMKGIFLGSVTEGVVHRANCPVLVIKLPRSWNGNIGDDENPVAWKSILVGYDHRPGSVVALGLAGRLAEGNNASITLMRALEPPEAGSAGNRSGDDLACIPAELERLAGVRLSYSPLSADWQVSAGLGTPWDALSGRAVEIQSDLIVVGPHAHARQPSAFIGTTAQRLLQLSPCSVLAVK